MEETCPDNDNGGHVRPPENPSDELKRVYIESYGIELYGSWNGEMLDNLWEALFTNIGYDNLDDWLDGQKMRFVNAGAYKCPKGYESCYKGETFGPGDDGVHVINFYHTNRSSPIINILHEIGHLVDNIFGGAFTLSMKENTFNFDGQYYAGWNGNGYSLLKDGEGSLSDLALNLSEVGGDEAWQQYAYNSDDDYPSEDWADIFANYYAGNINKQSDLGGQLHLFARSMEWYVLNGRVR